MTVPNLSIVLAVTVVLPLLVLVTDYVYRLNTGLIAVMKASGPDLCLLGLGSVGAIFIDPKVQAAIHMPPQVAGLIVTFFIFILRGACFRIERLTSTGGAIATMIVGIWSIATVSLVIVYSYW